MFKMWYKWYGNVEKNYKKQFDIHFFKALIMSYSRTIIKCLKVGIKCNKNNYPTNADTDRIISYFFKNTP